MDNITKYLLRGFWPIFNTVFSILFLITSIIIIISISNITSSIHITFLELFKMYMLSLPKVLFITLSISFFIAVVSLFSKHSESQELISFFATGIKPFKLIKPFFILALFLTIINLIILLISIPYAKSAFINFKNEKKQSAKFNFQTSGVSQRFGDWNIYTAKKNKNTYEDIILYNSAKHQFIIAKTANLQNDRNYIHFILNSGNIYSLDKQTIINFKQTIINQKIPKISYSIFRFNEYFKEFKKLFVFYLPFALLPITLIFFIPPISFFHPRIHKNRAYIYSIILIILFLTITKIIKTIPFILISSFVIFIIGYIFYKRKTPF